MPSAESSEQAPRSAAAATLAAKIPDHLSTLDGLRAVAVLLVVWSHLQPKDLPAISSVFSNILNPSYLGVDIFFVLSGFLITRILLTGKDKPGAARRFYIRRFARIFPIYYLTIAVIAWVHPGDWIPWWTLYLSNFALFADLPGNPYFSHAWSLAVEEHFYLAWPLIVYGLSRVKAERVIWFGIAPLAIASAVLILWTMPPVEANIAVFVLTPCRILSLGAGALLAFHEVALRTRPAAALALAVASATAGFGLVLFFSKFMPELWMPLGRLVGFSAFSTGIVLTAILLCDYGGPLVRPLASAPMRFIGRISYGIYLYHLPIFHGLLRTDAGRELLTTPSMRVGGVLAATLLLATLSYYLIEAPILARTTRSLGSSGAKSVA